MKLTVGCVVRAAIKHVLPELLWTAVNLYAIYAVIRLMWPWWATFLLLALLTFCLIVQVQILAFNVKVTYYGICAVRASAKMFKLMEEFFGEGNVGYSTYDYMNQEEECPPPLEVLKGGDVEDFAEEYIDENGETKWRWK